jgi:dihydrofolate reductase
LKEIADAQLIRGNWKATVDTILQTEGKDIWLFGGADLTHHFLQNNLIDEMSLAVHPIILGEGKPLFHSLRERKKFILKETKVFDSGLVQLNYTR